MIEVTFSEQSFDKCSWGSDEMGEYFGYQNIYFGYQLKWEHNFYFWYPKYEAVFNRWEQKIKDIPNVRFRLIQGGEWLQTVMERDGEYYLVRGARIQWGSDKPGPNGVNVYRFNMSTNINSTEDFLVKTERSLKAMLNKLDVTPL